MSSAGVLTLDDRVLTLVECQVPPVVKCCSMGFLALLDGLLVVQCLSASDTSYCSDRASERISGDVGVRWTCSMYIVTCRLDGCSRQICTFPPRIELDPKEGNHSGKGTTLDGNHSGK